MCLTTSKKIRAKAITTSTTYLINKKCMAQIKNKNRFIPLQAIHLASGATPIEISAFIRVLYNTRNSHGLFFLAKGVRSNFFSNVQHVVLIQSRKVIVLFPNAHMRSDVK